MVFADVVLMVVFADVFLMVVFADEPSIARKRSDILLYLLPYTVWKQVKDSVLRSISYLDPVSYCTSNLPPFDIVSY